MQETHADIAIIGGGIIGASALFFLAKKGLKTLSGGFTTHRFDFATLVNYPKN